MPATATPPAAAVALNAWLGTGLVVLNGLLFYGYFFHFGASENDRLFYTPVLLTFVAVQWLALVLGSGPPARRWFWGAFGLSAALAVLAWLSYGYLVALAHAFQH